MSTTDPRKNAGDTQRHTVGRPFEPGNSGRPRGARNRTTIAIEALLDGEAEGLTRKAIELGLKGDINALRLCLSTLCPPRRDHHVEFELPALNGAADAPAATAAIVQAVSLGELTPSEAESIAKLIEVHLQAVNAADLDHRIKQLEAAIKEQGK